MIVTVTENNRSPAQPLARLLQSKAGNTHYLGDKHPKAVIMCTPCGIYIALQHPSFPKGHVISKGDVVERYWEPFTGTVQLSN